MNDSINSLHSLVQKFCDEREWEPYHGPKDLAIGLVTEASELLEIFRFVPEKDISQLMHEPESRQKIADELADSLFFLLRFSQLNGYDLSQCLTEKMKKNAKKYPVEQFKGRREKSKIDS